jgi:hypothetical protein
LSDVLKQIAETLKNENIQPRDVNKEQDQKIAQMKDKVEKLSESTQELMKSSQAQTEQLQVRSFFVFDVSSSFFNSFPFFSSGSVEACSRRTSCARSQSTGESQTQTQEEPLIIKKKKLFPVRMRAFTNKDFLSFPCCRSGTANKPIT